VAAREDVTAFIGSIIFFYWTAFPPVRYAEDPAAVLSFIVSTPMED